MIKVSIIDDEKLARKNLIGALKSNFPDVQILGEANSVKSGIDLLSDLEPDLLFLDINLNDGSGFNILEELPKINFNVVFVTAYDQYAIRAFEYSALDYLMKPINPVDLGRAINKAKKLMNVKGNNHIRQIIENWDLILGARKLAIPELDGVRFVHTSSILRCESDSNYTKIYLKEGECIVSSKTLKGYSSILEQHGFLRVHRSHLVNINAIRKIVKNEGTYLIMENGDIVDVSRRKKEMLFQLMGQVNI